MRIAGRLALASFGVIGLALHCAAQTVVSEEPGTVSVAKQTAPERLAPPDSPAPKIAREDIQAAPPIIRPHVVETEQVTPRPTFTAPPQPSPIFGSASSESENTFASAERLLDWVSNYRKHRNIWNVPPAVHAMLDYGLFADEEKEWFCIGFIAGVLGTNPKDGPALVTRMFPLPDKEQEVIIRAIAYSGRPDWRELLEKNASRMPLRGPLIDDFLNGKRPTLMELPLDVGGADGIYALWGYYVATGETGPVVRIIDALRWSKNKASGGFSFSKIFSGWGSDPSAIDKITTGGTAKWTLASYAERDRDLITLYRSEYYRQPPEIARPLKDVIKAAQLFESDQIRKDQLGAIDDAQKRQMSAEAGMSKGLTAGSIAIATGCVAAGALGQPEIAVPCVIGGALYTGAAKLAH
jgi:hypothetical protein